MIFRRSERFERAFKILPASVQKKALKAFVQFAENPKHPSLQVKTIKGFKKFRRDALTGSTGSRFINETLADSAEIVCVFRNLDNHDECLKNS